MSFAGADAHHTVTDYTVLHGHHAAHVADAQAVAEYPFTPRKLVRRALRGDDVGHVGFGHGPDLDFCNGR